MCKVEILGYSERGVFNSIVFYLNQNPNQVKPFLEKLGISVPNGYNEFTLLNEQSFSKFGTCDLTIIATQNGNNKIVIFIEGKVKTYLGTFSINAEYNYLIGLLNKNGKKFDPSNIFVQLYFKFLLMKVVALGKRAIPAAKLDVNPVFSPQRRTTGNNGIVKKAVSYIENVTDYYYVAILPDPNTQLFVNRFDNLNQLYLNNTTPMDTTQVRCSYWGDIENFFRTIDANSIVVKTFEYNRGQIY